MSKCEVIVLGGGPAGYVAAIRAAQKGYSVKCISPNLGGTCLHEGCIPSKFLLNASHHYEFIAKHAGEFGIEVAGAKFDLKKIMSRKDAIINGLASGIEGLLKKNNVDYIKMKGKFVGGKAVTLEDGSRLEASKAVILATGSKIIEIPFDNPDKITVDNSRTALKWQACPEKLLVVGAGYIGLELASVWSRFGAHVTVIDLSEKLLPFLDRDVAKQVQSALEKSGIEIKLGVSAGKITGKDGDITVQLTDGTVWKGDRFLSAVGRCAMIDEVPTSLKCENKSIKTDQYYQASVQGVYAVGDSVGGALLAHRASDQAWAAIEHLFFTNPPAKPKVQKPCVPVVDLVPSVIYLEPEVACVGKAEHELQAGSYDVHKMPFSSNGRAMTMMKTAGFVKVICDKKDKKVLGVCVVGQGAEGMICQATIAMNFGATMNDIASICYPHPSTDEVLRETMFAGSIWGPLHG